MDNKKKMLIFNVILMIFGCIVFFLASQISVSKEAGRLGPDFWPKAFSLIIIVVSAIDAIALYLKKEESHSEEKEVADIEDEDEDEEAEPELKKYPVLLIAGIVCTFLYCYLQTILGFTIATVLYLASIMIIGRYRKPLVIISSSLIGTFVILFVFAKIVYLALPTGIGIFGNFTFFIYSLLGVK